MTIKEFAAKVTRAALRHGQGFDMYGYCFVNHEYGTEDYWKLEEHELSAYSIDRDDITEKNADAIERQVFRLAGRRKQCEGYKDFIPEADYCYLIGADEASWGEGRGEIIMEYPTVLARII